MFEARNAQRTATLYDNTAITDDISFQHISDVMLPAAILRKHTDFAKNSISFLRALPADLSRKSKERDAFGYKYQYCSKPRHFNRVSIGQTFNLTPDILYDCLQKKIWCLRTDSGRGPTDLI
jgi:hypothetical protein